MNIKWQQAGQKVKPGLKIAGKLVLLTALRYGPAGVAGWAVKHVDGAVNIPLADLKTRIAAEVPDKNDTIHVYCNVGRQSGQAQQMLSEMGYTQVVNAGGLSQIARPKSASK